MDRIEFIAKKEDEGAPLLSVLKESGISSSIIKASKYGGIFVCGEAATVRRVIHEGDKITLILPEERSEGIPPMDIPLSIVYEDEYILVTDKPSCMPTHPSRGNNLPTLANAVMNHYGENFVFRAVNRLDRDTSGLVLIAKDRLSAFRLSESMKRGKFFKRYECMVKGIPKSPSGLIDAPIERECEGSLRRAVRPDGKRALTEYELIERVGENARLSVILHTGRTHQIRVHMAYIGHPLIGDFLYGERGSGEYYLRCRQLRFPHPLTDEIIDISI